MPQIVREAESTFYRVSVESIIGCGQLWYSLDESFGDLVSESSDAALVGLLIPSMAKGEDIQIEGTVSDRLWCNLPRLQRLLQHLMPSLHKVAVRAAAVSDGLECRAAGVATGFSGGIDSYSVLADNHFSFRSENFRLSHLLFNDVGSHGRGGEGQFRERYERLLPVAKNIGLPLVMVNSNLASFYEKGLRFQQTHTLRNGSVALLLQEGIGRFLYASTYGYPETFVGPTKDAAYSDAITLPFLSTEKIETLSVGGEYTKVEKTLQVAKISCSHSALDVCVKTNHAGKLVTAQVAS